MPVGEITREDVRGFAAALWSARASRQSPGPNALGTFHSLIEFAIDEGWMVGENPVKRVEKPALSETDPDVHFLETEEVEAPPACRAGRPVGAGRARDVPDRGDDRNAPGRAVRAAVARCRLERATDPRAAQLRPRRVRHPKSKRSSRRVPLASRVATELELLSRESQYKSDDDSVFAHPETGRPIDRSKLLKRFKAALRRSDVRAVRFHDLRHSVDAGVMRPA